MRDGRKSTGFAVSLNPFEWRWGWCDAYDDRSGLVVGVWRCFGPIAICYDFD